MVAILTVLAAGREKGANSDEGTLRVGYFPSSFYAPPPPHNAQPTRTLGRTYLQTVFWNRSTGAEM